MDLETLAIIKKKILTSDAALQIISKKNKKIQDNEAEIQKLTQSHNEKFNSLKDEFTNYKNMNIGYMDKYLDLKKKLEKLEPKYNALFKEHHSKCELTNWNFKSQLSTKEQECATLKLSNTELTNNLEEAKLLNLNYEEQIKKLKILEERNNQLEARLKVFTNLQSDNTREILSGFSSAEVLKAKALYEECAEFVDRRMANEQTYDDEYVFNILKEMQDVPELITPFRDKIQLYDCGVQTVGRPSTVSTSSQTLAKRLCHKANQTTSIRRNQIDFGCQVGNQLETNRNRSQLGTDFGCQFDYKELKVTKNVGSQCINHPGNESTKDLSTLKMTKPVDNSRVSLKQLGNEDCSSKDFGCQFKYEEESNVNISEKVCFVCKKDLSAKSFEDFGCQFGTTNDPCAKQYKTKEVGCQYSNDLRLDLGTEEIRRHHKEVGLQCTQKSVEIGIQSGYMEQSDAETQTCNNISCIEVTRSSKPPTMKQALAVLKRANINITIIRGKVVKYSRNPPAAAPVNIEQNVYKMLMSKLNEIINSRTIVKRSYDSDTESNQRDDFHSIDSGYYLSDCESSSTRTNLSAYNECNRSRMENLFGIDEEADFKTYSDNESIAESEVERVLTEMRHTSLVSSLPDSPPKKRHTSLVSNLPDSPPKKLHTSPVSNLPDSPSRKRLARKSNSDIPEKKRKLQSSTLVANRKLSQITKRFKNTQPTTRSELISGNAVEVPTKKRIAHNVAALKITPPNTPVTKPEIIIENRMVIQPPAIVTSVRKFKKPVAYQKRLQNKIESFPPPGTNPIVENNNMPKNQIVKCAAMNEDKLIQNSEISNNIETANASSCIVNEMKMKQTVACMETQKVPNAIEAKEVCIRPETSRMKMSIGLNAEESNSGILKEEKIDDKPIAPKKMPWHKAKKILRRLVFYQGNAEKTELAAKVFQGIDKNVLINYFLTAVRIDEAEPAKGESPFEPCLTMTQKVIIGFLVKLENDYPNIIEDFQVLCEQNLLFIEEDATHVMRITKVYAALCKMKKQKMRLRRTMCDAMYQMGDLAVPFIHHVLVSWIQILVVVSDEQQLKEKPLIQVLIQMVHTKTCNRPEYFLSVLKNLLEVYYKYPRERYNENNLIKDFLQQFMCTLREDFEIAITILCKIKNNAWAFKQVELIQELINVAKYGSRDIVNALIRLIRKIQMQMCDDQETYAKVNEILTSAETDISIIETEMLDLEEVGA